MVLSCDGRYTFAQDAATFLVRGEAYWFGSRVDLGMTTTPEKSKTVHRCGCSSVTSTGKG